jgi:plastocyanin
VTKHLRIFAPLLAAGALAAAGCGDAGSTTTASSYDGQAAYTTTKAAKTPAPAPKAAATRVQIKDFAFQPTTIKVRVGATVSFVNEDQVAHTVTATGGAFDSGALNHGAKFSFTAKKAGKIRYVCNFHPGMTGTIQVTS